MCKKLILFVLLAIPNSIVGISYVPKAAAQAPPVIGDLNCSGSVNVVDVQVMIHIALGMELSPELDANADGYLDDCSTADIGICGEGTILAQGYCSPEPWQFPACPSAGMIFIPGGAFWMGCNEFKNAKETDWHKQCDEDEKPQHEVTLSAYWIDATEVTVSAYKACVDSGGCTEPKCTNSNNSFCNYGSVGKDEHPINGVTWCQAKAYCEWMSGRLPTEAEWEMAAGGGCVSNSGDGSCQEGMRLFPWGDELATCEYAVMYENGYGCNTGGTMKVGSKPKGNSPYGVEDLSGNVWEWVEDCYGASYSDESVTDPVSSSCTAPDFKNGCKGGDVRVVRGGSFGNYDARSLRVSNRSYDDPAYAFDYVSFRCARSIN